MTHKVDKSEEEKNLRCTIFRKLLQTEGENEVWTLNMIREQSICSGC